MNILLLYIREFYNLAPLKFVTNIILMVIIGMLEGLGILMIIPLLIVAGIIPGINTNNGLTVILNHCFQIIGLQVSLPNLLILYIGFIFGQSWLQRRQSILNLDILQSFAIFLSTRLIRLVASAEWQLILSKPNSYITNVFITELERVYAGIKFFYK
ncbi:hypothetical protein N752_07195 [Desulforamulus aquiferis]|nr:hypothetical protein [Desulforamulus aquiferis]RYD05674.1 hypothetical protein N752_07195 [Desulforamulus aquiferis]